MKKYTKDDVRRVVEEEDVEFIRLQFTDLFGNLKNMAITAGQLEKALDNRCMFDGSSVDGFGDPEGSDMYLYPDTNTMNIFPWRPQHGKVARLICDVYTRDRKPYAGDPRYVLKRAMEEAGKLGYSLNVGPECEFFLFQTDENAQPTTIANDQGGYFDLGPVDLGENARRDMVLTLEEMGFDIESSHHEAAPAQHEIDFKYDEALATADNIMTFKLTVKTIARRHGQHATFMPKPKSDTQGSGMYLNLSLEKDGKNIFADSSDPEGISEEARYFIGGLLKHIRGMSAVLNPLVNSYKRLVPGYEAPVYTGWGRGNLSQVIRVPHREEGNVRVELRSPDSAANPYLAIAVSLMAGLDGIKNKILPPPAVSLKPENMSEEERKAAGIERLPEDLNTAIDELLKDKLITETLGEHITAVFTRAKRNEWREYNEEVSSWEVQRYLNRY
ncbi:MAG: type I glutamate--ammonia ligase [Lachnospiraceae bacterium]|nr:type I glutamate--ammonia ligase [Lachnospiraceae bacterium]